MVGEAPAVGLLLSGAPPSGRGCQMLKGVLMPALKPCWSLKKGLLVESAPLCSSPAAAAPEAELWWLEPCATMLL